MQSHKAIHYVCYAFTCLCFRPKRSLPAERLNFFSTAARDVTKLFAKFDFLCGSPPFPPSSPQPHPIALHLSSHSHPAANRRTTSHSQRNLSLARVSCKGGCPVDRPISCLRGRAPPNHSASRTFSLARAGNWIEVAVSNKNGRIGGAFLGTSTRYQRNRSPLSSVHEHLPVAFGPRGLLG